MRRSSGDEGCPTAGTPEDSPRRSARHRELSRKWGSSEASPPPPGPCAWAGCPLSPPSRGVVGERNAGRFLQHFPAAGLVHSPSILPAAVEKGTQRPAVPLCEADQPFSGLLGFRMKRDAFLEELAPAKRLRAAGGLEALPDGVLGTVVDFLAPIAERDDQFCQRRRMADRMFEALAYNHEFMPLARDALALLGSCRLLRYGPLFARTAVFHHMLHQNFLELCFEKLAECCRLPQHELRALQITVERMSPAQARRHALEQALLRLAVRCTTARYRCNRHLARGAGLDRLTGRPLPSKLEDVEDEGKVKRLLV